MQAHAQVMHDATPLTYLGVPSQPEPSTALLELPPLFIQTK